MVSDGYEYECSSETPQQPNPRMLAAAVVLPFVAAVYLCRVKPHIHYAAAFESVLHADGRLRSAKSRATRYGFL